jgi:hypothetical protein
MMRRLSGACLAALVAAVPLFAKPPDLPENPRIVVAPAPEASPEMPGDPELPVPLDDPHRRILELLNNSEDLREIEAEWERIWGESEPSCPNAPSDGSSCCPVEAMLRTPASFLFPGVPLSQALETITCRCGLPIVVDQRSLREAGVDLDQIPVHLHVEGMTLQMVLDALVCPNQLHVEVKGCVVLITAAPDVHPVVSDNAQPKMCGGSVCPKCEELHAKCAGIREQVDGLMKACYLAIGEGRFEKAADLAREAHALDPARVEGDPLLYKMHLLQDKHPEKSPSNKFAPNNGDARKAPCQDPPLRPDLPGVFNDVVPALDAILTNTDELTKKNEPMP